MRPYLRTPWTDFHQIWAVDIFHHAPPIYGIQNAVMQKKFFMTSSLLYSITLTASYLHLGWVKQLDIKNSQHWSQYGLNSQENKVVVLIFITC